MSIDGPVPGPITLLATSFDLADVGYVVEEYVFSGDAQAYELIGAAADDGVWPARERDRAGFRTRLVVHRPLAGFSGTVVVEWLNVSSGTDVAAGWLLTHRQIVRSGAAWIGVSAQRQGIDGHGSFTLEFGLPPLQMCDPARYGGLAHPGDAFAFGIFAAAARAVGQLLPEASCVLAVGNSQSAAYLVTYVNAVAPLAGGYDGYLIHGRPGKTASLDGWDGKERAGAVRVRTDGRAPVLIVQSETDVVGLLAALGSRQPDDDRLRLWEVAGAAHADTYTLSAGFRDSGLLAAQDLAALLIPTADPLGVTWAALVNGGPQAHYVAQAALAGLERWVRTGEPPPRAARLEVTGNGELVVNGDGIARGGVRTPWVDVPVAALSGLGQGESLEALFGSTRPFDADLLRRLYPGGRPDYLSRFRSSAQEAVRAGFLLAEDLDEIIEIAACIPELGPRKG